jgi:hypothetical protein
MAFKIILIHGYLFFNIIIENYGTLKLLVTDKFRIFSEKTNDINGRLVSVRQFYF